MGHGRMDGWMDGWMEAPFDRLHLVKRELGLGRLWRALKSSTINTTLASLAFTLKCVVDAPTHFDGIEIL